uniref:Hypothetical secreted protein n=1 Tax=Glossina morsitans morsitans TaxID=37546 RepID=D3TSR6_GLOMM
MISQIRNIIVLLALLLLLLLLLTKYIANLVCFYCIYYRKFFAFIFKGRINALLADIVVGGGREVVDFLLWFCVCVCVFFFVLFLPLFIHAEY